MLSIFDRGPGLCDRLPRRAVLRASTVAAAAAALGHAFPLRGPSVDFGSSAAAASTPNVASGSSAGPAKKCILLFLLGGPPQHSTWDPKPDAVPEVRGEFGPIATSVPGLQIGELLPGTARLAHHLAVLRAVVSGDNAHSSSGYAMLTGQPHLPINVENANPGAPNNWPTLGAVLQQLHRGPRTMPFAMRLPHHIYNTDQSVWPGQDSGWLGPMADPWLFRCEPASADFRAPDLALTADVSLDRFSQRQSLLSQLERQLREADLAPSLAQIDTQREQALALIGSPQARRAFDLHHEAPTLRDRYGRSQFGQSVLLARRLVQAGVGFVQVNWFRGPDEPSNAPCWDSHANETQRLKTVLIPPFDQAFSALLSDLVETGELEETLVVAMAEFGRTPKFNKAGGRDHWGNVFSIAMAGAGIKGGVVHGVTDGHAAYPLEGAVSPADVSATIFAALGFPQETEIRDPLNRPIPVTRGQAIRAILA